MGSSERALDRGDRRARRILLEIGDELRQARMRHGLSQVELARQVGVSRNQVGRVERAAAAEASLRQLARMVSAVGLELSVRAYEAGPPVRDAAHLKLLGRFRARLPASVRCSAEVPLPGNGDPRAWDLLLSMGGGVHVAVEAETRLRDVQATQRALALKLRDDGRVGRLVLLLSDTRGNRGAIRAVGGSGLISRSPPAQRSARSRQADPPSGTQWSSCEM